MVRPRLRAIAYTLLLMGAAYLIAVPFVGWNGALAIVLLWIAAGAIGCLIT
jgi:hypothetical protein